MGGRSSTHRIATYHDQSRRVRNAFVIVQNSSAPLSRRVSRGFPSQRLHPNLQSSTPAGTATKGGLQEST